MPKVGFVWTEDALIVLATHVLSLPDSLGLFKVKQNGDFWGGTFCDAIAMRFRGAPMRKSVSD